MVDEDVEAQIERIMLNERAWQ